MTDETKAATPEFFRLGGQERKTDAIPRVNIGILARLEQKYDIRPIEIAEKAGFSYQLDLVTWTLQEKWPDITDAMVAKLDANEFARLLSFVNEAEVSDPL